MGLIYKITNTVNQKIYIGKTIRDVNTRFLEHLQETKTGKSLSPFHLALKEYGKDKFVIEILEDNINNNEINQKEQYYIQKCNAQDPEIGYNILSGGDGGKVYSKLTTDQVSEIINILKDTNNIESFVSIGQKFNVSSTTIRAINTGMAWFQVDLDYPIRKYDVTGLTLTKSIYSDIVQDLKTKIPLKDIQQKYRISEGQITAINQGQYCYNGSHPYYSQIYTGPFPIRTTNKQKQISQDLFNQILYDFLFTDCSLLSITKKYNVSNSSIIYIMQGKRRDELTSDFILPIQQNKEKNKEIFKQKFLKKEEE